MSRTATSPAAPVVIDRSTSGPPPREIVMRCGTSSLVLEPLPGTPPFVLEELACLRLAVHSVRPDAQITVSPDGISVTGLPARFFSQLYERFEVVYANGQRGYGGVKLHLVTRATAGWLPFVAVRVGFYTLHHGVDGHEGSGVHLILPTGELTSASGLSVVGEAGRVVGLYSVKFTLRATDTSVSIIPTRPNYPVPAGTTSVLEAGLWLITPVVREQLRAGQPAAVPVFIREPDPVYLD